VVTQLFYDNADFFRFGDHCPPWIMRRSCRASCPSTNYAQIRRIASLCKARLPDEFT